MSSSSISMIFGNPWLSEIWPLQEKFLVCLFFLFFFSSFLLFYLLETQEIFIEDYPEDKVCPPQHSRDLRSNCILPMWLFQLPVVPIPASSALFLLLPPRDLETTPSCPKVMTYECISRYASMLLNPQPAPYPWDQLVYGDLLMRPHLAQSGVPGKRDY
jgi:hypothetical protein